MQGAVSLSSHGVAGSVGEERENRGHLQVCPQPGYQLFPEGKGDLAGGMHSRSPRRLVLTS